VPVAHHLGMKPLVVIDVAVMVIDENNSIKTVAITTPFFI